MIASPGLPARLQPSLQYCMALMPAKTSVGAQAAVLIWHRVLMIGMLIVFALLIPNVGGTRFGYERL